MFAKYFTIMNLNSNKVLLIKVFPFLRPLLSQSIHSSRWHLQKNYYEILNLSRTCNMKEIRDAYIRLSKECHPDRNSLSSSNHNLFVEINQAYSVLSKPETRRSYDVTLMTSSGSGYDNRTKTHGYSTYDAGDCTSHENFDLFYQRAYGKQQNSSEKPKVATGKFAVFLLIFSLCGGLIQFIIVRWLYRNSYKNEVSVRKLSPAALVAQRQFEEQLAQMQSIMLLKDSLRKSTKDKSGKRNGVDSN